MNEAGVEDEQHHLEVEVNAAVVEVDGAEDGIFVVDGDGLGVQQSSVVEEHFDAGGEHVVEVASGGPGDGLAVGVGGYDQSDLHASVCGAQKGRGKAFVGNEVGRRDGDVEACGVDGVEQQVKVRVLLTVGT